MSNLKLIYPKKFKLTNKQMQDGYNYFWGIGTGLIQSTTLQLTPMVIVTALKWTGTFVGADFAIRCFKNGEPCEITDLNSK